MPLKSYKIFKCLLWYIDVFGLQTECRLELDYFFQIDNEIVLPILVLMYILSSKINLNKNAKIDRLLLHTRKHCYNGYLRKDVQLRSNR